MRDGSDVTYLEIGGEKKRAFVLLFSLLVPLLSGCAQTKVTKAFASSHANQGGSWGSRIVETQPFGHCAPPCRVR